MSDRGPTDEAADPAAARRAAIIRATQQQMNPMNVAQIRPIYSPDPAPPVSVPESKADPEIALHQLTDPDDAAEIEAYVKALEAFDELPQLQVLKQLAIDRTGTGPGQRVLDVGCGFGLDTLRLAQRVGPDGAAVGVDISEKFVADARRRASAAGLTIDFSQGDAQQLSLPDDSFDITRTERVLVYLAAPAAALAEMIRVTRPGGAIAIIEPDFDTNTINVPDQAITRKVLAHGCDTRVANGWLVRDLRSMLADAGLREIELATRMVAFEPDLAAPYFTEIGRSAGEAGVIDSDAVTYWVDTIANLHRSDKLLAAVGYCLFTARLPS